MRFWVVSAVLVCAIGALSAEKRGPHGIRIIETRESVPVTRPGGDRPPAAAGNFAVDLEGDPDDRPGTWGRAGAVVVPLVFRPPAGYRVRLLGGRGNCQTWPTLRGVAPALVDVGRFFGVLCGAATTGPAGSTRADLMADNTVFYVQTHLGSKPEPFEFSTPRLLEADHTLNWIMAVWLNDTGLAAHIEVTFYDLAYEFVPEEEL